MLLSIGMSHPMNSLVVAGNMCLILFSKIVWSNKYFALQAKKIHGTQCCGTTPRKLEMIRSFAPLF
jgi:hypothetical protein